MVSRRNAALEVALILLLAAVSYFIYGAPYSFRFDSDNAVHVLMAADFSWEEDFYYWAQNRLGSLSSYLGSFLVKLGIPPIQAVTLVKYGWMVSIALLAKRLIGNRYLVLITAVSLFFPSVYYFQLLQVSHPYAEQLCIILLSCVFLKNALEGDGCIGFMQMVLLGFLLALALWVNDATFVFLGVFALALFLAVRLKLISISIAQVLGFAISFGLPASYVLYRKFTTIDYTGYGQQSVNSLGVFFSSLFSWTLEFQPFFVKGSPIFLATFFVGLVPIFACLSLVFVGKILKSSALSRKSAYVPAVLISASIALYVLVCLSEWYIKNGSNSRYMISSFYLFFIALMMLIKTHGKLFRRISAAVLALAISITVVGAITGLQMTKSGSFHIDLEERDELRQLYGSGLIGGYWYSYAISAYAPDKIAATPRAEDWMRDHSEKNRVLSNDTIFLVKQHWLEEYPDTVEQFGVSLKRVYPNLNIEVGNARMSAYEKMDN